MMSEVHKLDYGLYLLNDGETAQAVARRVYGGDVHKSNLLLIENGPDWSELERIKVPNKKGRVTELLDGESTEQLIHRLFPNQPTSIYRQPFYLWNGGVDMKLYPGDLVYVPER